jgi:hypothetical protein
VRKHTIFGVCSLFLIVIFAPWAEGQSASSDLVRTVLVSSGEITRTGHTEGKQQEVQNRARAIVEVDIGGSKLRAAWRNPLCDLHFLAMSSTADQQFENAQRIERCSTQMKTYSPRSLKKRKTAANLVYDSIPTGGHGASWW